MKLRGAECGREGKGKGVFSDLSLAQLGVGAESQPDGTHFRWRIGIRKKKSSYDLCNNAK